uniref:Uncharacterized protein n=1 Tax=Lepeophtheirus salmonis TaxID=72036 RepID=A0A0K2UJY1_LEPSM
MQTQRDGSIGAYRGYV